MFIRLIVQYFFATVQRRRLLRYLGSGHHLSISPLLVCNMFSRTAPQEILRIESKGQYQSLGLARVRLVDVLENLYGPFTATRMKRLTQ